MSVIIGSIQIARKTNTAWNTQNPTLKAGQLAAEVNGSKVLLKVGDGATGYTTLKYITVKDSDEVTEGAVNLFYTNARVTAHADTLYYRKSVIDGMFADGIKTPTPIDCSGNPNYPASAKGISYKVSVAGKIGGAAGVVVEVGDLIVASVASAGGTHAAVGSDFGIYQTNVDKSTEVIFGTARRATTTEGNSGTDDEAYMTSLKVKNYADSRYLKLTGGTISGSLAISGVITSTNDGQLFHRTGASELTQYFDIANTGGRFWLGVNNSAGNALLGTGGSAYSIVLAAVGANSIQLATNSVAALTIAANQYITTSANLTVNGQIASSFAGEQLRLYYAGSNKFTTLTTMSSGDAFMYAWTGSAYRPIYINYDNTNPTGQATYFGGALNGMSATFSGKLRFSGSTTPTAGGDIGYSGTYGLYSFAQSGSTDDWSLFAAAGGYVMHVPAGTSNLLHRGFFKTSSTGAHTNASGLFHEMLSDQGDWTTHIRNTHASNPYGIYIKYNSASPNGTGNYFVRCDDPIIGFVIGLASNGGIQNFSANNTNLSDRRTKKEIWPVESFWKKIKGIEVVKFKYKHQSHDDFNIGVIAQQVNTVAPEFVDVDGFGETPKDGIPLMSVYDTDIQYAALKALQEAMARIEKLEAKLKIYEN